MTKVLHDRTIHRRAIQLVRVCKQGRHAMGDKGGKRDKDKGQKQRAAKDAAKKQKKQDKQAKARQV